MGRVTGLSAVTLAFTGVLAASLFQSAAAGMISIVEDRENDFSRELFVTPVSRLTLVGGKIAGETLVALCQGACIVVFALAFGVRMSPAQLALLLVAPCLACCLLGGAFGLATIAVLPNQRSAMQIFQFLIIPQYVLGGVLVPLREVPPYLRVLAHAMPMTLCGRPDPRRVYAGTPGYRLVASGSPLVDAAVTGDPVRRPADRGRGGVRLPGANPLIRSFSRTRREGPQVTGVTVTVAQQPVLRPPEQVSSSTKSFPAAQRMALAVVPDQVLRPAAVHGPAGRAGRGGDGLPGLGLPLGDHQPPAGRGAPSSSRSRRRCCHGVRLPSRYRLSGPALASACRG